MRRPRRVIQRMPAENRFGGAAAAHGDFVDLDQAASRAGRGGPGKGEGKARLLAERFQPGREIDRVADDRIGQARPRSEIPDNDGAACHADADIDSVSLPGVADLAAKPVIDRRNMVLQRDGGVHGTRMVVGLCQRRVPEGHDAVADEFVQRAAMRHDDLACLVEDDIDQPRQRLRVCGHRFRQRREAANIHEHHRDLGGDAAEFRRRAAALDGAHHLW